MFASTGVGGWFCWTVEWRLCFFLQWIEHGWIRSKTWTDKLDWEISAPVQWVNSTSTSSIKQFLVERRLSEGVNVKTTTKIQNSSLSKGSLYSTESSDGLSFQCYRQSGVRSTINFQLNWLPTVFSALWSYVRLTSIYFCFVMNESSEQPDEKQLRPSLYFDMMLM